MWSRRLTTVALGWFAAAVAAGLTLVVVAQQGAPFDMDLVVRDWLAAHPSGTRGRLAGWLTLLGSGAVLYPVSVLVAAAVWRAGGGRAGGVMTSIAPVVLLAAGQVLELVLYATIPRPVPGPSLVGMTTVSSGHTAAAVLGWGLIAWQMHRWQAIRAGRPATPTGRWYATSAVAGAVAGLVVAATRVQLGQHWLTDVVIGLASGAVLLLTAYGLLSVLASIPAPAGRWRQPAATPEPAAMRQSAVTCQPRAGRCLRWLRTSPWAWSLPIAAAVVPVGGLLAEPAGDRLKDLLVYHGAGGVAGSGESLYAFRTVFGMPFTYPPFAGLLLEPLSRMPVGIAQALWTIATLAAVVAIAATVLRPVAHRIGLPLTVAAMLLSSPVRSHLRFGQVGVFLVLLVTLDLLGRTRRGGWGVGLAAAAKLTPAIVLPWLALTRQWRRLGYSLGWLAAATVAGLVLLWPSAGDYLSGAARDMSRFGANDVPGNQSVRGMLLRALPELAAERVWLAVAVPLMVIGLVQAWRCERAGNRLAAVGVLAALSVAVSPISWVHHLVWLVVPLAALAAAGRFRLVIGWFLILTISFPTLGSGLAADLPVLSATLTNLQGLTAVAAVLWLPALARAMHGASEPSRGAVGIAVTDPVIGDLEAEPKKGL